MRRPEDVGRRTGDDQGRRRSIAGISKVGHKSFYLLGETKPLVAGLSQKIFTIFEGTSEIQRLVIGRAVTGLPVR